MRKLRGDRDAQLLMITGVVLTLMLLLLATLKVNSANILRSPTHKPDAGFSEIDMVSTSFKRSLVILSEKRVQEVPGKEAISTAFDELSEQYNRLLADYGTIFITSRGPIRSQASIYSMDFSVTLVYQADGEMSTITRNMVIEIEK